MGTVKNLQSCFCKVDIGDISIDPRSRDEIPAMLKGLQYIYINTDTRNSVFAVLDKSLTADVRNDTGKTETAC